MLAISARPAAPPVEISDGERAALCKPPKGLSGAEHAAWTRFAEQALAERTLTPTTVPGFVELCRQSAYVSEIDATIQRLGIGTKEAEPYLKQYVRLAQRYDASLARFKLTAFGKPVAAEKPKQAANPWAQVARK